MSRLRKISLFLFSAAAFTVAGAALWLFFFSRDLPDTSHLAKFAPLAQTSLVDACLSGTVTPVPLGRISPHLRNAVATTEISPDGERALASLLKGWFRDIERKPRPDPSMQIARTLFCTPSKQLNREIAEIRVAIQLDERFSRQDLFTIYLNRLEFGECGTGVENAAQCFFHKHAADLNAAQSALLAGIIRSPSRLSPSRHADRALERRNAVLDEMVAAGKLSFADGQAAKAAALLD